MVVLQSNYSNEVSAELLNDVLAPGQVLGLAYSVEQGKVILTWDAVEADAEGGSITDLKAYRIFRKEGTGEFALISTTVDATATHTDTTAKDGASYTYAVAAIDLANNEGAKSEDKAVKTIPSVPTNLVATPGEEEIRLDWVSVKLGDDSKLNENLAGYNVYRSEKTGADYSKVGTVNASTVTYTDEAAVEGKTYFYVVTSFDNSAE